MHPLADTGRVIAGRYRLQAPIGRGAMGVVWRARDQLLDRDVAVKEVQIADSLTDVERAHAYQRTLREAKTAARLNHPAVVTVYDVAEDEGRPWIVMQLIHAQSLDQVLATSGPLAPRRVAEIGHQLLSALTVAHAAGVMHRDVKPSNVLLGADDRAVLTDFGIATFQDDPKLTQTGMVMGSPGFTAPERIRGEDASPASDLWSLGATLFAAVEGHGPYEKRGGALTTMSAIINEDAPGASGAGALGPVIAALLRREPGDRPDAGQAARMITEVLPQLAERTSGTPTGYVPTALSASPPAAARPGAARPGEVQPGLVQPGAVPASAGPPRVPQPNETVMDVASAEQTISREPPGQGSATTAPRGGQQTPASTAPTESAPARDDAARYGSSARPEAPAPDFSSWYDSSPRSGPAGPPGSGSAQWSGSAPGSGSASGSGSAQWSGSGYPEPLGYGPGPQAGSASQPGSAFQPGSASHPGSASQPGAGPVPWSGAQPGYASGRRERSGLWWKVALVVLAVIGAGAGVTVVLLIHHNDTAAGHGTATSSSSSSSSTSTGTLPPSSLQIVDAINKQSTGTLPGGYATYSQPAAANEKAGFSLAAPTSWKASTSGYQTYLRDATLANVNLLVDLTPHTYMNDMLKEATYIKNQSLPRFPGYKQLGLARLTIRGQPGAYWKFTWDDAGVQQEAIDLLYLAQTSAGPQSYALYMTAPVSEWTQMRPVFDEQMETFNPAP